MRRGRQRYLTGNFNVRQSEATVRLCYEKAAALVETDTGAAAMLLTCFTALGDGAGVDRAARLSLARVEAILAHDRDNGMAMDYGVAALAALGEADRAIGCAARC